MDACRSVSLLFAHTSCVNCTGTNLNIFTFRGPTVFWITNPKVILTNNVAAGAEASIQCSKSISIY